LTDLSLQSYCYGQLEWLFEPLILFSNLFSNAPVYAAEGFCCQVCGRDTNARKKSSFRAKEENFDALFSQVISCSFPDGNAYYS
jgi:hypothetical protein